MSDPTAAAPFSPAEIAAMREAADEDRHLARVVATHDAFTAERDRIARLLDRWKWAHGERIVRLKATHDALTARIGLLEQANAGLLTHAPNSTALRLLATIADRDARLRAAEKERDALQSRFEGERDRAEAIQRARQRTEEECERRVREAQDGWERTSETLRKTYQKWDAERQRAGRLHALLIEARDDWLPSIEAFDGQDDGPAVFYAKVDAELLAAAAPAPDPRDERIAALEAALERIEEGVDLTEGNTPENRKWYECLEWSSRIAREALARSTAPGSDPGATENAPRLRLRGVDPHTGVRGEDSMPDAQLRELVKVLAHPLPTDPSGEGRAGG